MTVQAIMELTIKRGRYVDFRDFMVKVLPETCSHKRCVRGSRDAAGTEG